MRSHPTPAEIAEAAAVADPALARSSSFGPYLTESRASRRSSGRWRPAPITSSSRWNRPPIPHNAAAIVRTAEALGVLGVHVVGVGRAARCTNAPRPKGAFRWVDTRHHDDLVGVGRLLSWAGHAPGRGRDGWPDPAAAYEGR